MRTLVLGASGATGKHVVQQLLDLNQEVKVLVRATAKLPESWKNNALITTIEASVLDIPQADMAVILADCDAVVSCLGHNLTFKGIYGKPRRLVRDAVKLVCNAIIQNKAQQPVKFVLMNTTGNRNGDLKERVSFGEKMVVGLIRMLLPPQADNEQAADYLRIQIGQENPFIAWTAVRPDGLIDEINVSAYDVHSSPTRSAIFNAGKTSRINVAHFMMQLITNADTWSKWKGQMPVIYNCSSEKSKTKS